MVFEMNEHEVVDHGEFDVYKCPTNIIIAPKQVEEVRTNPITDRASTWSTREGRVRIDGHQGKNEKSF